MPKKKNIKKQAWWVGIKPKTGFQLALVILFLLSMVVGVWAISNSQELRSQAAGKKVKDVCAANSDTVCKGKKIGKEVTKDGQRGTCEAKKKPKAGENVKCEFKAQESKSVAPPAKRGEGGACSKDSECGSGLLCRNNKCAYTSAKRGDGASCENASQCVSGICKDNACFGLHTNQQRGEYCGEKETGKYTCVSPLVCASNRCN